jgi:hypothetical protein
MKQKTISNITCSERTEQGQEHNPATVADCSIQYENGDHSVETVREIEINGDVQIKKNPNVGETYIEPNEEMETTVSREKLRINATEKILKGQNQ